MKREKVAQLVRDVLAERDAMPSRRVVVLRTLEVDFDARRITIDGRVVNVEAPAVVIPILSGDAVFMSRSTNLERIG